MGPLWNSRAAPRPQRANRELVMPNERKKVILMLAYTTATIALLFVAVCEVKVKRYGFRDAASQAQVAP